MHRTDTFDVASITDGSAELILEAARVSVSAGDWVIMPGVVHGWEAGSSGCTIAGVGFGLGRPDGAP
jgi:quercetin dioxygenase-like cupin family protein